MDVAMSDLDCDSTDHPFGRQAEGYWNPCCVVAAVVVAEDQGFAY